MAPRKRELAKGELLSEGGYWQLLGLLGKAGARVNAPRKSPKTPTSVREQKRGKDGYALPEQKRERKSKRKNKKSPKG